MDARREAAVSGVTARLSKPGLGAAAVARALSGRIAATVSPVYCGSATDDGAGEP